MDTFFICLTIVLALLAIASDIRAFSIAGLYFSEECRTYDQAFKVAARAGEPVLRYMLLGIVFCIIAGLSLGITLALLTH